MFYFKFLVVSVVWSIWLKDAFRIFFSSDSLSKFLVTSAFLAPFYSVSFPILSFQLSIYKLIIPVMLLYVIVFYKSLHKNIIIIAGYFFVISLFSYVVALENNYFNELIRYGRAPFSAYAQPILQGLLLIITISAPWMLINKNTNIDAFEVFAYYIYGCASLVILGWIQILFYIIGLPWFDFWFLLDAFGRSAETGMSYLAIDRGFYRMSSLGGEPRHFGSFIALSIILLIWVRKNSPNHLRYIHGSFGGLTLLLLISGLCASLSSSALLSFMIGLFVYFSFTSKLLLFVSGSSAAIFLFFFYYLGYTNLGVGEIVEGPFSLVFNILWKIQSIDMMLYAAPKDAFAIKAIFNDVWHFLLGYGINMADLYVPEFFLSYDTPFGEVNNYNHEAPLAGSVVPTSGILQIILGGGAVGGSLLVVLLFKTCIPLDKSIVVLIFTILCMVTVSSTLMFTMGAFFTSLLIYHGKTVNR